MRCELHGVADQIEQNLPDSYVIKHQSWGQLRPPECVGQVFSDQLRLKEVESAQSQGARIDRSELDRHLPGFKLREIQEIIHRSQEVRTSSTDPASLFRDVPVQG